MKKTKFTEKDYRSFKDIFMASVGKLGTTEYSYCFSRIDDDDTMACTSGDLEQMNMSIKFAVHYQKFNETTKEETIRVAAEHEALEVLLWPMRMKATEELGEKRWREVDSMIHTLINRLQYLIFK